MVMLQFGVRTSRLALNTLFRGRIFQYRYLTINAHPPTALSEESVTKEHLHDNGWLKSAKNQQLFLSFLKTIPSEPMQPHPTDFESLFKDRSSGSNLSGFSSDELAASARLLSSLLTFPLTISHTLCQAYHPNMLYDGTRFTVSILGGRAESSLPLQWWKEMLFYLPSYEIEETIVRGKSSNPSEIHSEEAAGAPPVSTHSKATLSVPSQLCLRLKFIGPHVQASSLKKPSPPFGTVSSSTQNNKPRYHLNYQLRQPEKDSEEALSRKSDPVSPKRTLEIDITKDDTCYLHDHPSLSSVLYASDLFVLFHPGYGSKEHSKSWKKTLLKLLDTKKPILCTAYSPEDLNKDLTELQNILEEYNADQELDLPIEMMIKPQLNPFASLRKEIRNHEIIITNQYYYLFRAK
jgi:hypothetical protein